METIEGVIFYENGTWVTEFMVDGRTLHCKIDYCPWCGKALAYETTGHAH